MQKFNVYNINVEIAFKENEQSQTIAKMYYVVNKSNNKQ